MTLASLSISGEITLNLHSLNNEGGEGNQIITRQLTIIDQNGEEQTVNGISGDMFKHIHAGHLLNYAAENSLPLSTLARIGDPNRISPNELNKHIKKKTAKQEDIIDGFIQLCTITDTHGTLMTEDVKGIKNTPRKSTIEFGWVVGKPGRSNSDSYFHSKISPNTNPIPFNRPANHGIYAFVCNLDIYRIGLNDMSRKYAIKQPERKKRYKAILQSLISTFLNPRGAMISTQKPHITNFKGVVSTSNKLVPAPTISALKEGYDKEIEQIKNSINKIESNAIDVKYFDGMDKLTDILTGLIKEEPYKLPQAGL